MRVYADTSVFGGVFDEEFCELSQLFFEQVREGTFVLVSSAVVQAEIEGAPLRVRQLFAERLGQAELLDITAEALTLRDAYLKAEIVSSQFANDALHVALATVAQCELIVSWNFKHIVHFDKISLYNAVNTLKGFSKIAIFSPAEVVRYENEEI